MANYRGYFSSLQGKNYRVDFITSTSSTYTEITMAGDEPFVVDYDISDGPFDAMRTSQATINIVSSSYLYDIYSSERQHTKVVLTDITDSTNTFIEWCGYVQPQMDSQSYVMENETITISASDCISSLQYYEYEKVGEQKQIVTFKQLLDKICTKCGQMDGYQVVMSKKIDNAYVLPSNLKISESNFYSEDTDEPWTYQEVLEEICKYLGYTALQWHNRLYLIDYQWLHSNSSFTTKIWYAPNYTTSYNATIGGLKTIAQSDIRGNGGQISFDTTYDKATVNCSNYYPESIIPEIMEDGAVENLYGSKIYDHIIREGYHKNEQGGWTYASPTYINKNGATKKEEEPEVVNYYNKVYKSKNFTCKHYTPDYSTEVDIENTATCPDFYITNWGMEYDEQYGTTIVEYYAVVKVYNLLSDSAKTFNVGCTFGTSVSDFTSVTIAAHSYTTVSLSYSASSLPAISQWTVTVNGLSQTVTDGQGADNDELPVRTSATKWWGGATIIDLGRQEGTTIESSIPWSRYIAVAMKNQPSTFEITSPTALTQLKPVLVLNSDANIPAMITGNETYIAIDGSVIFERYPYRDYVESEWTSESSKPSTYAVQNPPCLVFKLKLGSKYWNGSGWTTTESAFRVPLDIDEDDDIEAIWNKEYNIKNNIDWKDMSGLNGYGIPLSGNSIDGNMEFEMLQPLKVQDGSDSRYFNGYCFVSDLTVEAGNNNSENAEEDVVYENNINSGNCINKLDEIELNFTTTNGKLSFSNVGYGDGMLSGITEENISNTLQTPEENIIQKYVMQYGSNRHKLELELNMDYTPFQKINEPLLNKNMINAGSTIDYAYGKQEITLIEIN